MRFGSFINKNVTWPLVGILISYSCDANEWVQCRIRVLTRVHVIVWISLLSAACLLRFDIFFYGLLRCPYSSIYNPYPGEAEGSIFKPGTPRPLREPIRILFSLWTSLLFNTKWWKNMNNRFIHLEYDTVERKNPFLFFNQFSSRLLSVSMNDYKRLFLHFPGPLITFPRCLDVTCSPWKLWILMRLFIDRSASTFLVTE